MTARTAAASGMERWNWEAPVLMWRWERFLGGPIGPEHGVEGRLAAGGLFSGRRKPDDATDPTSPPCLE